MMPFLISHLGDRMYGLWLLLGSFFGFYGLMDFGLASAVQRYLSRALGQEDHEEANKVFNSSLVVFCGIGLASFIFSIGVALIGYGRFADPTEAHLFRIIVILMGFNLALRFPMRSFWSLFACHLRYDLSIYVDLVILVLRTGLIIYFLNQGHGLLTFAVLMIAGDICNYLTRLFISFQIAPYIRFAKKYFSRSHIKKLFDYSIYSFICAVSQNLKFNIDNFVITAFVGLSSVTLYSVAGRLITYYMHFIKSNLGIVIPVFSAYEGQNNHEAIRNNFLFLTKISTYMAFFVAGCLYILGESFIVRWVGVEYQSAYTILLILLGPVFLHLLQLPSQQVLYGISKHKAVAIFEVSEAILNVTLSLILVQIYGLKGVAMGTAISMFLFNISFLPIYTCRTLEIAKRSYVFLVLRSVCIAAFFMGGAWYCAQPFVQPNYFKLLYAVTILTMIYCSGVFFVGLPKHERALILRIFQRNKS